METKKNKRNSNVEVLRFIAMVMIVMHHYSVHGLSEASTAYSFNEACAKWLASGGMVGVDIFVMITGFYMCSSKVTFQKLAKIWGQTAFYAVLFWAFFVCFHPLGQTGANGQGLLTFLFPISHSAYWFLSAYFWLMLVSPLCNLVLHKISTRQLLLVISSGILLISIIPMYLEGDSQVGNLGWFVVLYLCGALVRRYVEKKNYENRWHAVIMMILYVVLQINTNFQGMTSWVAVWLSMEALVVFASMKPRYSMAVSWIGSTTLGIYLIHDHEYMRDFLWNRVFQNAKYYGEKNFLWIALGTVGLIMVGCIMMDSIRQITVGKIWDKLLYRLENRFKKQVCEMGSDVSEKLSAAYLDLFRTKKVYWTKERKRNGFIAIGLVIFSFLILGSILWIKQTEYAFGAFWIYEIGMYGSILIEMILVIYLSLAMVSTANERKDFVKRRKGSRILQVCLCFLIAVGMVVAYGYLKNDLVQVLLVPNRKLAHLICFWILLCFFDWNRFLLGRD